jgi:hypothetical protein
METPPSLGLPPLFGLAPDETGSISAGWIVQIPHDVTDLHYRVQNGRTMAAAAAAELAAFHETPVTFWGLTGPSACEVALSVADRVVTAARSAAGLGGGGMPTPADDVRALGENLHAVIRALADLKPPDPADLLTQATQEVGRAIRLRALGPTAGHREAHRPNGPGKIGTFHFGGKPYRFPDKQWHLFSCLWKRTKAVSTDTVLQKVFGKDVDNKEKALDQLRKRVNDKLLRYRLPFRVEKQLEHWTLIRLEL